MRSCDSLRLRRSLRRRVVELETWLTTLMIGSFNQDLFVFLFLLFSVAQSISGLVPGRVPGWTPEEVPVWLPEHLLIVIDGLRVPAALGGRDHAKDLPRAALRV